MLECSSQALNSWEPLAEVNPTSCSCPAPRCHFHPLKRKVMKWLVTLISTLQRRKDHNSCTVLPSALPSSGLFSSSPCPLFICEPTAGHCFMHPPDHPQQGPPSMGTAGGQNWGHLHSARPGHPPHPGALPRPSHMAKQRHWECPCLARGWPVIGHVSFGSINEALFPETTGTVHSFADVQPFSQRPAVTAEIGGCDSCSGRPETDRPSSLSWAGVLMSCAGRGQEEWHAGRPCGPGQATWHHLPRDCLLASPLAAAHPRTAWGGWGAGGGQDSSQTCSPFRAHAIPRPTPPCPLLLQPSPPDIPLR